MNDCLKIMYRGGDGQIKAFFLDQTVQRAVFGSAPDCEIHIPKPFMDRHHAILFWDNDEFFIMFPDGKPSANGLKVNGESLGSEKLKFNAGCKLAVGNNVIAGICLPGHIIDLPPLDVSTEIHELDESASGDGKNIYGPPSMPDNHDDQVQSAHKPATLCACADDEPGFRLINTEDDKSFAVLNENHPIITIGRNPTCDIQTSNPSVSRVHAMVRWVDGRVYVQDPPQGHPTNGITVDDMRLQRGTGLELFAGSKFRCGNLLILVVKSENSRDAITPNPDSNKVTPEPLPCIDAPPAVNIYGPPAVNNLTPESHSDASSPVKDLKCDDEPGFRLINTEDDKSIAVLNANHPVVLIGRNPTCDIHTSNHTVSRVHAMVTWIDGKVFVQAPPQGHPTNGIKVDGMSLQRGNVLELFAGSKLHCGGLLILVENPGNSRDANTPNHDSKKVTPEPVPCVDEPPAVNNLTPESPSDASSLIKDLKHNQEVPKPTYGPPEMLRNRW